MSETLQKIFDDMPVATLVEEEQRVAAEIARLQERSQMIARAIVNKYVTVKPTKIIDKWID